MRTEQAIDRVRRELHQALDSMRVDLDRVEILSAALNAFSKPIPDYEPAFRHLRGAELQVHKLG
ncbi:MAG: hypothetical protein Q8M26_13500 [Pseudolabrys sp.]|nr:hypothetical protein [Pseudolabrys sp.]